MLNDLNMKRESLEQPLIGGMAVRQHGYSNRPVSTNEEYLSEGVNTERIEEVSLSVLSLNLVANIDLRLF